MNTRHEFALINALAVASQYVAQFYSAEDRLKDRAALNLDDYHRTLKRRERIAINILATIAAIAFLILIP